MQSALEVGWMERASILVISPCVVDGPKVLTRSHRFRDGGGMQETPMGGTQPVPITIVLVEDHAMVAEQLTGMLGQAGIVVLATATTLQAGYEAVLACRPDVVVIDDLLPDGLGVCLCRRLTAKLPGIPVVMHAGTMTSTDRLLAIVAGATAVILKNIRLDPLIEAIRISSGA